MKAFPVAQNRAFTLIELLVVISIISLLSSVILANINSARQKARDAAALSTANEILKRIVECDTLGGKITTPTPLAAPTNQFCTTVPSLGTWPQAPEGHEWSGANTTAHPQANIVYTTRVGTASKYLHFHCGINPGLPSQTDCANALRVGQCRLSATFTCARYNTTNSTWE